MNEKDLNAWIEINVFGKQLFSEMRGQYEWFYFCEPDKVGKREKANYKPRDWSEYDYMKHILPDNQPHQFTRDGDAAMLLLERCIVEQRNLHAGDACFFFSKDGSEFWLRTVVNNKHLDGCAKTLPLAIALFAKQLFSK